MPDIGKLKVMNAALSALGNEVLTDLNDEEIQGSGAAQKLLRQIELSRDVVLARHGWLCALEYTRIPSEAADAGSWKYPYVYRMPGDCLRVWIVGGDCLLEETRWSWGQKWELGTVDTDLGARQIIRARNSQDNLPVAYVRRCSWGALSPHLVDAIGLELAGRACVTVNGDRGMASDLKNQAEKKILLAISVEGTQEGGQDSWAPSMPEQIRNMSR